MDKEIRISITAGTVVTVLVVLLGAYVTWLLRDLVLLVLTAIIIASAIEPGVAFFIRWRLPRFAAALLVYMLVFGAVFSILFFMIALYGFFLLTLVINPYFLIIRCIFL